MLVSIHSGTALHGDPLATIAEIERIAATGIDGYWAPMLDGWDSLTLLAAAGAQVPGVPLGTAVAPIPLRSPYALAQQARTIQALTGGRLTLGLGVSHPSFVREKFRQEWRPPLAAMGEYLDELLPLLDGADGPAAARPVDRPPVVLGAVNPAMARLAAERADGIVTWAAGVRTLQEVIFAAVAEKASGRAFRVIASLPLAVTDDADEARALIQSRFGANDAHPTYAKVLAREGVSGIGELSLVGDETAVAAQLDAFAEAGVGDFAARIVTASGDDTRAWEFLSEYARRGGTS